MKRLALVALVLSIAAEAGSGVPRKHDQRCRGRGDRSCTSLAFFEFAPFSGAGMGAACACTTPTGAKGEALTFTRASNGTCTKGNPTTGIQNGDLVVCSTNQPRVGNPDGLGLALLVESSRQNVAIQNQAMDNVAWANFIAGAGTNPTKGGADTDVDPFGTTTAEKVTFNATGAADSSGLSQTVLTAATWSGSIYAIGNATTNSGTIDVCLDNAATATCFPCAYVQATWTRCLAPNVTSKVSGKFYVGNLSSLNGGTTRSAQTVTLSLGQAELGAYATSPIPTTTIAVTRAGEAAYATTTGIVDTSYSYASTAIIGQTTSPAGMGHMTLATSAAAVIAQDYIFSGNLNGQGVCGYAAIAGAIVGTNRIYAFNSGSGASSCGANLNGTSRTGTGTTTGAAVGRIYVGSFQGGSNSLDGYVRQVCVDPSPARCR